MARLLLGVSLLLLGARLTISKGECPDSECNSNDTETLRATTTTVTFGSSLNCSFSVGVDASEHGSIAGLIPGTVYQIYFSCWNCCMEVTTKPEVVNDLTVTDVTTDSVSLTWTEPRGKSSSYVVRWTDGKDNGTGNTNETSTTIADLAAQTEYDITVTAVAEDGWTAGKMAAVSQYTRPERVGNLAVTDATASSVSLSWTEPEGRSSLYRVRWTNGTTPWEFSTGETALNVTELTAGVLYRFTVIAVAGDDATGSEEAEISHYTKPEAVRNLSVSGATTSSVCLTWTEPVGSSSFYRVQWADGNVSETVNVTQTSVNISGLTAGVQYEVTVTAVAGDGLTGGQSSAVAPFTRPERVGNLAVTDATASSVSLSWTEPEGRSSLYRVRWTNGTGAEPWEFSTGETALNVTELTAGVLYRFTVVAVAGDNATGSEEAEISHYTKPEAVRNLSVSGATTSSVCLTWTEPVGSSSFYRVQWADGNVSETLNVTQTSVNISGLTAGVQYEVTVTAVAGDGLTGGQSSAVAPFTRPERVGNLAVTDATASSVSLSWTEPEGRSSLYRVRWTNGTTDRKFSTGETALNVTELTAGVLHRFTVVAVAGDDATGSEEAEISHYTRPEAVRNLSVSGATTSSVCLTWTEPVGSSSFYRVQWADGNVSETLNVTQTSVNISGLTAGVQYEVTVTAVAGDGLTGGQSSAVAPFTRPGKIGALSVDANTTSIYLHWTPPPGEVFRYKVVWNSSDVDTPEPFAVLSDLIPGTAYAITVFAIAGDDQPGEPHSFTAVTVPATVGGLRITDATMSSVSLGWTEPEGGATSYEVQWTAGGVAFNGTTTNTAFTVRGLTPGSQYSITVAAGTAHSPSRGETRTISTFTRPEKPENVTVTSRGTEHLNISWALPEGSSEYFVVNISNLELQYFSSGRTTVPAARWTGLAPGRVFGVTVTAVAGAFRDSSDWSAFATFPTPPGSLTVSERTNSSLLLEWATPPGMEAAPHVSFCVTYQPADGGVLNQNATGNNTELSPLSSGTSYNVTVVTVGPENLRSTAVHNSSFTLPNPVLNLAASPRSTSSVAVRWSYPLGARPYYEYSVQAFSATGEVFATTVGTNGADVPDLEPGSRYRISVTAVAAAGSESVEEEASSYTKPKAVTDLRVEDANTTAVRLTWLRQSDHKPTYSYLVTARQDAMVVQNDSAQDETYTLLNLTPGELYVFDVVAVVGGVKSTVNSASGYTKPAAVSDVTLAGNATSLWASWRPAAGRVDSYAVLLFRGDRLEETHTDLSNNTVGQVFPGRKPGTLYCVVVAARRGTFESNGSRVCNATFPNPPGPVMVERQTVDSINFTWAHPEDMDLRLYGFIVSTHNGSHPAESNWFLLDRLQSGSLYHVSVVTVGVWNYTSTAVTADNYTRPYPVAMLPAEITTDSVTLVWKQPESKPHYSYLVLVSNGSTLRSDTVIPTTYTIDGLVAGSNYSFTVTTQTADGTQAAPVTVSCFTQPERVEPRISSQGSNSSILVSWDKPPGKVERYTVHLNGSGTQLEVLTTDTSLLFEGLSAGRLYAAMVTAHSGPASSASASVSNATFPNPPGLIDIRTKTTGSIGIQWGAAPLMSGVSFRYRLTISSPQRDVFVPSNVTGHTFTSLLSGTSYNISVATVGVMDLESERVQIHSVTTRPFSVKQLAASTEEESITVAWVRPDGHKEGYRFNVSWRSSGGDGSDVTEESEYRIRGLVPGTPYNLSVTTETSDGTRGDARQVYNCTNASPVTNLTCEGPNKTNAELVLSWSRPSGQHSSFRVTVNDTGAISGTVSCCNHSVSGLRHYSVYGLSVETLSCGRASAPASKLCRTGVTNPPVPGDDLSLVLVREKVHNRFSLQVDPQLLDDANGPITHVGVLVTLDLPDDTSDWRRYLGNTYDHWKEKKTPVYLATVVENISQSRSAGNPLKLEVGDGSQWKGYANGPLVTSGKYQYGVVLFTSLSLQNDIVDGEKSLVSRTNFYPAIELTGDPAIPGIAIGATLGIFSFLFMILIGFIIHWRRLSHKESSDIQIHSLRAKVGSVGVGVEEYEDYYRKQKADSNCGFAEEFEDLKVVGTDQSKTNAVTVENKPKNRYNNVLPYDSSRVKLSIVHGSPYDDYINANYIPGYNSRKEFIATQGPLPATVNEFWRMIWEKNVQTLVMLARCNEQGRVKCEQYWVSGTKHFENITVTTTSEIPLEDWTIRDISIKNVKTAETRSVRQFHFTAWPDHGVPETTELLISFRHLVREHMDQYSRHSPTVVHCSAGVGRTGTFIAIDRLIFQIERDNLVDVYGVVHDMRMHRPLMVQTEDQYVFLNQCAMDIIRSRTGTNVDLIYQNITALSIYENVEPHKNGFHNA